MPHSLLGILCCTIHALASQARGDFNARELTERLTAYCMTPVCSLQPAAWAKPAMGSPDSKPATKSQGPCNEELSRLLATVHTWSGLRDRLTKQAWGAGCS